MKKDSFSAVFFRASGGHITGKTRETKKIQVYVFEALAKLSIFL
jgi:hypothetical protein